MKRIISCMAALALAFSCLPALPYSGLLDNVITAEASDVLTYGYFEYDLFMDNEEIKITNYTGPEVENLVIPNEINGKKVTWIHYLGGYYQDNGLGNNVTTSITIPSNVRMIDYSGFVWYSNLQNIIVDKDNNSFVSVDGVIYNKDMTRLEFCPVQKESVFVPKGVTVIVSYAFQGCKIKKIDLPDTIIGIGQAAFRQCYNLTSISLPDKLESISSWAFSSCINLDSIIIPDSTTFIGNEAFSATAIENIIIPSGITNINYGTFKHCQKLKNVTIPDSVTNIDSEAFFGCVSLLSVTIPKSVKDINNDYQAFGYYYNYKDNKFINEKIPNFKIYCYSGTAGEQYAKENGFDYELLDAPKSTDLKTCTATLSKTSYTYTYTGSANKPTVTVKNGAATLNSGTDYTVSYKNNINAGTAIVTITGKGNYTGTVTKTFKINAASIKNATVSDIKNKYYTGKAITLTPTVKLAKKTLKNGTDYTITYKNNKAIGTATVTIKGKGNYSGSVSKTFKIIPKKTTLKKATSPKKGQLKVTYSKQTNITGYQITYALDKDFTKSKASKSSAKLTKTISGLKSGTTYYVKVRTYKTVNGTKYYSGYSSVKAVKVK